MSLLGLGESENADLLQSAISWNRVKSQDGETVLEKLVKRDSPLWAIMFFDKDYMISRQLKIDEILKPLSQEPIDSGFITYWELPEGDFFTEMPVVLPTSDALLAQTIATMLGMTESLVAFHAAGIVHGGIYGGSWFQEAKTGKWRILNLGFSFYPGREPDSSFQYLYFNELIPFISPEQSGRTGRVVDTRSDL
ncbi:MAG: VOC family protein [Bacteroidia bacterium]